jgi:transposase
MRGTEIRCYPSKSKQRKLARWCARSTQLWNLMLDLQKAAYSGENRWSGLAWRPMWAQIVKDDYVEAERIYRDGKRAADKTVKGLVVPGKIIKEPGVGREEEREELKARLKQLETEKKKKTPEFQAVKDSINRIAPKPEPVDPAYLEKIFWHWRPSGLPLEDDLMFGLFAGVREALRGGGCQHTHRHALAWLTRKKLAGDVETIISWLKEHGGACDCQVVETAAKAAQETAKTNRPGIFIPVLTLQKIMARLKRVKQSEWIGDLPSHAAQAVVKDLDRAIGNMLRERGKVARGEPSRKTGFPRRKRAADGSVYLPNTTVFWNFLANGVKLPNGVGTIFYEPKALRKVRREAEERKEERQYKQGAEVGMIGARIWRRGRQWYLSVQWQRQIEQLPQTGRTAGVKVNASIPITVYEDRRPIKEYPMPPVDAKLAAAHKEVCRAVSRTLDVQKKREEKLTRRKRWQRQRAADAGKIIAPMEAARLRRSRGFHQAKDEIARLEKIDQGARDDFIHDATTKIVRLFDAIAVQKMDVAGMMKDRDGKLEKRHERRRKRHEGKPRRQAGLKIARKMMRRAAMARIVSVLQYKFTDLRGEDSFHEIDKHDANACVCSRCGTIHPDWQDGRRIVRCNAVLPDGSTCGNELGRAANAARVSKRELDARKRKETAM